MDVFVLPVSTVLAVVSVVLALIGVAWAHVTFSEPSLALSDPNGPYMAEVAIESAGHPTTVLYRCRFRTHAAAEEAASRASRRLELALPRYHLSTDDAGHRAYVRHEFTLRAAAREANALDGTEHLWMPFLPQSYWANLALTPAASASTACS